MQQKNNDSQRLLQKHLSVVFLLTFLLCSTTTHAWNSNKVSPKHQKIVNIKKSTILCATTPNKESSQEKDINKDIGNDGIASKMSSRGSSKNNNNDCYFIRKSMLSDMGRASEILADGFYKGKTNFFMYHYERFETFLSLESSFPSPFTLHEIFVACDSQTGKVLGLAELDARPNGRGSMYDEPYMCNLAVDENHQRKGIAAALVRQCEDQILDSSWKEQGARQSLYLKVKEANDPAVSLYEKLGYLCFAREIVKNEAILHMRKDFGIENNNDNNIATAIANTTVNSKSSTNSTTSVTTLSSSPPIVSVK